MMTPRSVATLVVIMALAGCTRPTPETKVDVQVVHQKDLQTLPTEAHFVAVRDLVTDGQALWVLDGAPPFISRVSLMDEGTRQFGREGEGPGEFLNPWAIQPTAGPAPDGVLAWDLGNDRVSMFDDAGAFLGSERLSEEGRVRARRDIRDVTFADPFRVRATNEHVVVGHYPERIDQSWDLLEGSLRRADYRLEPGPEVAQFRDYGPNGAENQLEWLGLPLWDACDGSVVLWSPGSLEVVWLDLKGGVRKTVSVPGDLEPLRENDIGTYLKWMGRLELGPDHEQAGVDYLRMARSYRHRFADMRPLVTDVRCGANGAVWLRRFDTAVDPLGRSSTWLNVVADGTRHEVRFPVGFTPGVFIGGGAYGLLEVPEGHQKLVWWNGGPTP